MTPHQVHAKTKKAIRLARQLRDAAIDARCAVECCYDNSTGLPTRARHSEEAAKLTLGLISDVFCQTGDRLLEGVSK